MLYQSEMNYQHVSILEGVQLNYLISMKTIWFSRFFQGLIRRTTGRKEIPRGLRIPKSHNEGDWKTRDSKRAAYPKILEKPVVIVGFLKVA